MGIDAKEKTALGASVGADAGQSIQMILTTVYPLRGQNATGKWKIQRKIWRKCTAKCSVWPTRATCTRSP